MTKYQDKLMDLAKGTVKLGIVTGVGGYAVGKLGALTPGTAPAVRATNTALNLVAVGNLANVGLNLLPNDVKSSPKPKKATKKSKANEELLKKIWG